MPGLAGRPWKGGSNPYTVSLTDDALDYVKSIEKEQGKGNVSKIVNDSLLLRKRLIEYGVEELINDYDYLFHVIQDAMNIAPPERKKKDKVWYEDKEKTI